MCITRTVVHISSHMNDTFYQINTVNSQVNFMALSWFLKVQIKTEQ